MPRRGPRRPLGRALTAQIVVRLPPGELAEIEAAVERAGLGRSEWVRRACRAMVAGEAETYPCCGRRVGQVHAGGEGCRGAG